MGDTVAELAPHPLATPSTATRERAPPTNHRRRSRPSSNERSTAMKIGNASALALVGTLVLGPMTGAAHAQPNPAHTPTLVNGSKHAVSALEPGPRPDQLGLQPQMLLGL